MATINGIDTDELGATIQAVKDAPELARVTFAVDSKWDGGFRMAGGTGTFTQAGQPDPSRRGAFRFASDEPAALLGTDTAVSPGEYVLAALAACYSVTFAANAAAEGIELDRLEFELEGDFDLHGFLGLDPAVRPGMQQLRVNVHAESANASREQLEALVRTVEARSPIRDTLASGVTVSTSLAAG